MGQRLLSLKGASPQWRGKTTLSINDRGERRFIEMENCYVSSDGSEIRHFPGFATILDLSADNNDYGYARNTYDAVLPIIEGGFTSPNDEYYSSFGSTTDRVTLRCRAKPVHYHCFEQIRDTLLIVGESRFREVPLMSDSSTFLTATHVAGVTTSGTVRWTITMSGSPGAYSGKDTAGCGFNGLTVNDILYTEGFTVSDAAQQAFIDTNLNGRIHEIKAIVANVITLHTIAGGAFSAAALSAGEVSKVRDSRSDIYSTPNAVSVYDSTLTNRPDDLDCLTSWRIVDRLSFEDIYQPCYPAWVANRQRDFGDATPITASGDVEGIYVRGTTRGASRREQRRLPFRVNPEPATDRLILAAPAYNCLFEIPLVIPINPDNWPDSPTNTEEAGTFSWVSNHMHDKPRCLGIPKARLVESTVTPVPSSPSQSEANFSALAVAISPDVGLGLMPGEYQFAISYEDEATGEEGLASEIVSVTIPSNNLTYTLRINYIHPGWLMPECLATSINVYIAPPGEDALAYYCSFPLSADVGGGGSFSLDAVTGFYGRRATSPDVTQALISQRALPMKSSGFNVETDLDPERLAPQSASMPRGGESARYVRGVLFTIGHLGETGGSLDLWESRASHLFNNSSFDKDNEIQVRAYFPDAQAGPLLETRTDSKGFGIGGRNFPDAYEGITFFSKDLLPGPAHIAQVDRVLNRQAPTLDDSNRFPALYERLRLTHPIAGRDNTAGVSPTVHAVARTNRSIWYQMPKGQVQIGDPGAPWRASKALIQFIDPNKGDDGVAIGQLAGTVVLCSRKETYTFSWARNPGGEIPNLLSNEYGCIAANSMVEFDGGLAWLSERGPVAIGASLQFVGADVMEDFFGIRRRYLTDSRGMMRHAFGCHDAQRGLVYWGLRTEDGILDEIEVDGTNVSWFNASDQSRSRFPCDEVLVWSYRSGAFTTWRPPLKVYWMRAMRDRAGEVRICFLGEDGRIYALDDYASDTNLTGFDTYPSNNGEDSTTLVVGSFGQDGDATTGRQSGDNVGFVREGMLVEFLNDRNELVAETTVASAVTATSTITLATACTWRNSTEGWKVRVGGRQRMTLVSTYIGDSEIDPLHVDGVQMRYTLHGIGLAHGKVALETSLRAEETATTPNSVAMTDESAWRSLGGQHGFENVQHIGRRIKWNQGGAEAFEVSVRMEFSGGAQVRINDIGLELSR